MIHFEWPWLLTALPLPLLVRWLLPANTPLEQSALKVPFLDDFSDGKTPLISKHQQWPLLLATIAWFLLVIACTRPQWLGEPIEQAVSGRDLMLAVDLSGSMEEQDFLINKNPVDRLTAIKWVASDFINRRIGDRIGLILFGTQAYLQIGDAIGLAVKRLKNQPANSRVLILLTDGANTAGEVSPLKAAELAAANQLKIYTIGVGADEMIVRSFFGNRKVNPSQDLDENTLVKVAESTGGRYFRARNSEELNNIYMLLDKLEPVEKDKQYFRPRSELYFWPLSLALGLTTLISLSRLRPS